MSRCEDERDGVMLFPYELGLLSEEEAERFERHLLKCTYCHERLAKFEPYAALLKGGRVSVETPSSEGPHLRMRLGARIRAYFWPRVPLPLRPAVLVGLIALLLFPSLKWLGGWTGFPAEPVTVLVLSPVRSAANAEVSAGPHGLVISVPQPAGDVQRPYMVRVKDADSNLVYEDRSARAFGPDGWCHLLFAEGLSRGDYRVTVLDRSGRNTANGHDSIAADYWFKVH